MMKIVTFNLRCVLEGDGINSFWHRSGSIINKINAENPDIICFQEGKDQSISFLMKNLADYQIFFNQRDDDYSGEGLATAIKKEALLLEKLDFFWLSDTPNVPGSRYPEQSKYPRICQCLLVKRITDNKLFRLYNIHLDHISEQAKILGMKAVMKRVTADYQENDLPFFIFGDFNATPDSDTIAFCNSYSAPEMKDLTECIVTSYHGFGTRETPYKIDYIYADKNTASGKYNTSMWEDSSDGIYLSDHYPICVEIDV